MIKAAVHALSNLLFQGYFLLLAEKQQFLVIFVLKWAAFNLPLLGRNGN